MYTKYIKRVFDVIISFVALAIFIIPIIIIAIISKNAIGSPIFFFQERIGKNEKAFKIMKFRTMSNAQDEKGMLLPDELRLTKFGKILRNTSLDELPQLLNVFIGNMAMVGPRPLLVEYLPLYSKEQRRRHSVRPGLTNLVVIHGRNNVEWREKFALDTYYIDNLSFKLDIVILVKTAFMVFKRSGVELESSDKIMTFFEEQANALLTQSDVKEK